MKLWLVVGWVFAIIAVGLVASVPTPDQAQDVALECEALTAEGSSSSHPVLTASQAATLSSIERISDHPFYTMRYVGSYRSYSGMQQILPVSSNVAVDASEVFACSLFVSTAADGAALFGRNFDWMYHPILLLFTDPPDAYASVSFVDLDYFVPGSIADKLDEVPLEDLSGLLETPFLPFDGMNEQGLVVGMAAVPPAEMPIDDSKETRGSIDVIRDMLDYAATVDEAISIVARVNVDMMGGPDIHYLVADASGKSAIIELADGEIYIFEPEDAWQHMTNFRLHDTALSDRADACWRYAAIAESLQEADGDLDVDDAMGILRHVAQASDTKPAGTLWSAVYEIGSKEVHVAIKQHFETPYSFSLR